MTFADALRAALTTHGWTAYRLAQHTGLSQATLSRLLSGRFQPYLDTTRRIAAALGLTLDQLCAGMAPVELPPQS